MGQGNVQGNYFAWTMQAKADLSAAAAGTGKIYKAVSQQTGDVVATGQTATGILQTVGTSGQNVSIGYFGSMKFTAALALSSVDLLLTPTTGGFMKIAGSGDWIVGKNLYTVTSGGVVAGLFNFLNPWYYNPTQNSSGT